MADPVGSLFVHLGLDSAQFNAGLARASSGLQKFAGMAGKGLVALSAAGVAAAGALGYAVKGAIDAADQMGELAEKTGVSVEALSSLSYVAKMSGSDAETLATSLRKLSVNMFAVAQGSAGPVATAFRALGVSVKDADGNIRSADSVLLDIADKFALLDDGATKTALAVQLFGKSGAELVPFLSRGRDGIEELQAEADRLGVTLSAETAAAAGDFNDSLDRLMAGLQGIVNKIMQAALPALNALVGTLTSESFSTAMSDFAVACIRIAEGIAQVFIGAHKAFQDFMSLVNNTGSRGVSSATTDDLDKRIDAKIAEIEAAKKGRTPLATPSGIEWRVNYLKSQLADLQAERNARGADVDMDVNGIVGGLTGDTYSSPEAMWKGLKQGAVETGDAATDLDAILDGLFSGGTVGASAMNAAVEEGKAIFEATRTPAEKYAATVAHLNDLLGQGAINQDTYTRAVTQAQDELDEANSKASDLAETIGKDIGGALSGLFDSSKSVAEKMLDIAGALAPILFPGKDGKDGIGNAISDFISGLNGFQTGGSFQVGGAGALDSQVVAFRASPGENVSITKPGQQLARSERTHITFGVSSDNNGNLMPFVDSVATTRAGQGDAQQQRAMQRNAGRINKTWSDLRG